MRKYNKVLKETEEEAIQEILCNVCGRTIEVIPKANVYEDHVHIEKMWGYFSNKDLTKHSFDICEQCYDQWVSTFAIPINDEESRIEWIGELSEETPKQEDEEPRE